MRLARVYARFFKSFNFDYERRARENAIRHDWEQLEEGWYPYVRLDVDPEVTAVVGANESGKSHLLDAIECVVGVKAVRRSDFCRHSQLYSIETHEIRLPDVGAEFIIASESEAGVLAALGVNAALGQKFLFIRPGVGRPFVSLGDDRVELDTDDLKAVEDIFPRVIRFSTKVAIPDSVPISILWGGNSGTLGDRRIRSRFIDMAETVRASDANEFGPFVPKFLEFFSPRVSGADAEKKRKERDERELARKLLVDVARVDQDIFKDLQEAISSGNEGDVSGLVGKINQSLTRHLNLSRWWTQDSDFALRVSPRERELVFTIQDRTESEYSFAERSRGLTHFLAYFVQLRAHLRDPARSEILLMDEPDAYLSNAGQQDLLRVLENFAVPDNGVRRDQVVYVTHSPFLINKNAAHRLRVLDKGTQEEGTRVVKDVARTHYEPLRSSLGAYVAETAFISGKNLIVEGVADQVLLAGMSNALRAGGHPPVSLLDLNEVTIVPAGSADSVPYIAYLARGRDPMKPPCVALLDGDKDGERAAEKLRRSEVNRRPVLDQKYISRLDVWAAAQIPQIAGASNSGKIVEIEDLIPPRIAIVAARRYAVQVVGVEVEVSELLKEVDLRAKVEASARPLWDELRELFSEKLNGETIDKVGFAREVVAYVEGLDRGEPRPVGVPSLEENFTALLGTLASLLDSAAIEEAERRRSKRMGRIIRNFVEDYQEGATRAIADSRLREIEGALADIASHDIVRQKISGIRRDFHLRQDPNKPVDEFESFVQRFRGLLLQERLASQSPVND